MTGEAPPPPSIILSGDKIIEFDDLVNDKGGCWLYLDKLPPPEEEDPKKAKAAPKGKVPTEELKPAYGRVWVNLKDLQSNASFEQRFLVKTYHPSKGESEAVPESVQIFEPVQTYINLLITLDNPINPPGAYGIYPSIYDYMPAYYNTPTFPTTNDAINDFKRSVHLSVRDIAQEYAKVFALEREKSDKDSPRGKQ